MPYVDRKTQDYFAEHMTEAKQPGDLTYTVYRPVYKMWKDEPRFKTFFELTRGQRNAKRIPIPVQQIMIGLVKGGADADDVFAAYDCCVQELWTRHVADYEKKKLEENGDVQV